jgi:predicted RecA/RadA family phage recombinase
MARTYVQPGNTIDAVAGVGGVKSGDIVLYGALVGIAEVDAVEGASYALNLVGVHRLVKASGQINAGAQVWLDNSAHNVVNASSVGLYPLGAAVEAAGSSDTTVLVRLSGIPVTAVPGT